MFVLECLHITICGSVLPNSRADQKKKKKKTSVYITNEDPREKQEVTATN